MPILLSCRNLNKSFGARPLFTDITLGLADTERLGLIGPNGSGKSTFLRILAGVDVQDAGEISRKRDLRISYVAQNDDLPDDQNIEQILLAAIASEPLEDYERTALLKRISASIGFESLDQAAGTLSGGWRKRLAIGVALIKRPELVLLDEPTNHLDIEGILWLEGLMKSAAFGFVVVSHDRLFLENVTNRIVEMNSAYADGYLSYEGNYSNFLVEKEEYLKVQAQYQHALEGQVKREVDWLRRGPQARTTKASYRIDAAHKLIDELADVKYRNTQDRTAGLDFIASDRKTKELLKARGISRSVGSKMLFTDLDITLTPGTRLGILGSNGSGKSTLIRVLTGRLDPETGSVFRAPGLNIVYFDQHRTPLDPSVSLRRALSPESDTVTFRNQTMHVNGWARRFLFKPEQLDMPVGALSGGEQARIMMANLMRTPADLLVLDEPTNDLDIPSLEVLEQTLTEFPGALILVTHDRFMLDNVSTQLLALNIGPDAQAGYYADYSQWEREQVERKAPVKPAASTKVEPKQNNQVRLNTAERRELEAMETTILTAEEHVETCQAALTAPEVVADHVKMDAAWKMLQAAQDRVTRLYARWEELESKR